MLDRVAMNEPVTFHRRREPDREEELRYSLTCSSRLIFGFLFVRYLARAILILPKP